MIIITELEDPTGIIEGALYNIENHCGYKFIRSITSRKIGYGKITTHYGYDTKLKLFTTDIYTDNNKKFIKEDIIFLNKFVVNRGSKLFKYISDSPYSEDHKYAKDYKTLFMTYLKKSIYNKIAEINENIDDVNYLLEHRMVNPKSLNPKEINKFISKNSYGMTFKYDLNINTLNLDDFIFAFFNSGTRLLPVNYIARQYESNPKAINDYLKSYASEINNLVDDIVSGNDILLSNNGTEINLVEIYSEATKYFNQIFKYTSYDTTIQSSDILQETSDMLDNSWIKLFNFDNDLIFKNHYKSYDVAKEGYNEIITKFNDYKLVINDQQDKYYSYTITSRHYLNASMLLSHLITNSIVISVSDVDISTTSKNLEFLKKTISYLKLEDSVFLNSIRIDDTEYDVELGKSLILINEEQ